MSKGKPLREIDAGRRPARAADVSTTALGYVTQPREIGEAGSLFQGIGTLEAPETGLKAAYSPAAGGAGLMAAYVEGVEQWSAGADGKLRAGDDQAVILDADGLNVTPYWGTLHSDPDQHFLRMKLPMDASEIGRIGAGRDNFLSSGDYLLIQRLRRDGTVPVEMSLNDTTITFSIGGVTVGTLSNGGSRLKTPAAVVYNNANQSIADNTATALGFNSERYDNNALHDNAVNNTRLTAPVAGIYHAWVVIDWAANATGERQVRLRVTSGGVTTIIAVDSRPAVTDGNPTRQGIGRDYQLAAGDYFDVAVLQKSGGPLNLLSSSAFSPEFGCHLVSAV